MFQAIGCLIEVTAWSGLTVYRLSHLLGDEERKSTFSIDELTPLREFIKVSVNL